MGFAAGCVKCCLNTVNTVWAIGSIAILALAAILIGSGPAPLIYLMFVIGGIGIIAAVLGCCGICQEHIGMTIAYAALIGVSLILQIGGMIFANQVDSIREYADEDITKLWNEEVISSGPMNLPQQTYKCCGKDGPFDYTTIQRDYPKSCYPYRNVNETLLYTDGCIKKAEKAYVDITRTLLDSSWGAIAITIILMLFAIFLIVRFRRKQQRYNY